MKNGKKNPNIIDTALLAATMGTGALVAVPPSAEAQSPHKYTSHHKMVKSVIIHRDREGDNEAVWRSGKRAAKEAVNLAGDTVLDAADLTAGAVRTIGKAAVGALGYNPNEWDVPEQHAQFKPKTSHFRHPPAPEQESPIIHSRRHTYSDEASTPSHSRRARRSSYINDRDDRSR